MIKTRTFGILKLGHLNWFRISDFEFSHPCQVISGSRKPGLSAAGIGF